jgi:hypothetical protein
LITLTVVVINSTWVNQERLEGTVLPVLNPVKSPLDVPVELEDLFVLMMYKHLQPFHPTFLILYSLD